MDTKRISLRFNLDNESDRIAWEYLETKSESKNRAIIEALRCIAENEKSIAEIIRETISDCLKNVTLAPEPSKNEPDMVASADEGLLLEAMDSFLGC